MIAAIVEIILFSTDKCVLVCSQSNSACDDIAKKLLVHLNKKQIFRMYATSYNVDKLDPTLSDISNYVDGQFQYPCLKYLYGFRVVVCTIATAGCITRSRGMDPDFNPKFFSHTFIDEAAFVNEISTMVPISGWYKKNP